MFAHLPNPLPDAEQHCHQLADQIRPHLTTNTALIGIYSGGAWIAERLCQILKLNSETGLIDVSFYRDDYREKGLHTQIKPTRLPFAVEDRHIILVDDVLYTGRTVRAALNEIFDYGRPAKIELAVLADRGGRELPVAAQYCPWQIHAANPEDVLVLTRDAQGRLSWKVHHE